MNLNLSKTKKIVVKLGTDSVIKDNKFNSAMVNRMAKDVSAMVRQGKQFIIVSSGAIGMGLEQTNLHNTELSIEKQQAMAAIGQCRLMYDYEKAFAKYNQIIAQVLITQQDFENPKTLKNLKHTLSALLSLNVVPIINENDVVATEELAFKKHFSDNDVLAAKVASHIKADLLVMASDVGGLFTENPKHNKDAVLLERVKSLRYLKVRIKGKSSGGRGGFSTKLEAAEIALKSKIPLIVTKGSPGFLSKIMDGKVKGTLFKG
ncbi:MAG: glutamate 5-kinase [Candidatus Diapherotrites archaeon]|uniref:Glutamate 5-kinase n=1 Tax=Candidatus Iainarchaeum sp. TaxID=3101447 RepID=A0A2D6M1T4_9ARCH|nr:glutamate 5-kinase [Candidatus Diapherotrites archaeon]|tara:strand:- start:574 stop:1359 length:786 start_codon:yes stop_codon:yes gene_type:complete